MLVTTQEKEQIRRLYFEERYTYGAIGGLYGVSKQRVHQIVKGYMSFSTHGFSFARFPYLKTSFCKLCSKLATDIHHINHDSSNNKPSNLIAVCKPCHRLQHKGRPRHDHRKGTENCRKCLENKTGIV